MGGGSGGISACLVSKDQGQVQVTVKKTCDFTNLFLPTYDHCVLQRF